MALKLYMHPLSSYCWKVLIALYESRAAFEPKLVNLGDPAERAAFTALWPTAKIPLLEDELRGRIIPETSIMIEYLDTHYPGPQLLLPADREARLEARLWDRLFDSYVMTPMQRIVADRLRPESERDAGGVEEAKATLRMAYGMIEKQLAGQRKAGSVGSGNSAPTYVSGDFTIADCAAAPALFYASIVVPFPKEHALLAAYFERLLQRASVARAIAEARPYFQYFPYKDAMPARFLSGTAASS